MFSAMLHRWNRRILVDGVAVLFALAVCLLPLAHHDILCHLKSSTHCTTCVVGSSGEAASDAATLTAIGLHDTGAAALAVEQPLTATSRCLSAGRAPPLAV
jgi:hypothetical protein